MPAKEKISELYNRYLHNDLSKEDLEEFFKILHTPDGEKEIEMLMNGTWQQMFKTKRSTVVPMYKRTWYRVAAAVIFIVLSAGAYFLFNTKKQQEYFAVAKVKQDVAPGRQGAILTIGSGKQIVLDSAADGKISDAAVKNGNEISYVRGEMPDVKVENNTMTTPKGRQFELVLADGSKVWLNAASSITYPTAFTGNDRKVSITGEAYFEVVHNSAKPFTVEANGITVEDLGTHFNINAYDDEAVVKTTLLEGSVRVSAFPSPSRAGGHSEVVIKPGQQATVDKSSEIHVVNADVNETMAWKDGLFHFESADLKTILREFARWYDVEVVYEGNVSDKEYFCIVNKNTSLANVLKALQASNIRFRIDGKKLFVEQ